MKKGYDLLLSQSIAAYFDAVEVTETSKTIILHLEEKS